ncbi:MAG: hypothetical protein WA777_17815 [Rhodanobacter sp.]
MSELLHETLAMVVPDLQRHCRDPWVLIGSAAARLIGADITVADVDVLTSVRDAEGLIAQWQSYRDAVYATDDSDRFRSRFARFRFADLPVELMGGLELNGATGWHVVQVQEIATVSCGDVAVRVPSRAEQIRILESFGRPKDLKRAALLHAL